MEPLSLSKENAPIDVWLNAVGEPPELCKKLVYFAAGKATATQEIMPILFNSMLEQVSL